MKSNFVKTLTAAATLMLLLAGCASMGGSSSGTEMLSTGNHSNMKDEQYKDVHNQADFDALWQQAFANQSSAPSKPAVDFSNNMVLTMFLGEQKHGGYIIRFTNFDASGATVNVTVEVTIPGTNCRFPSGTSEPYAFASAPATTKQVNFNVTQRNAPACG
ncbi:MAG: protease complex subunit PrcB family protein [Gammaproteobacteria bacterium]